MSSTILELSELDNGGGKVNPDFQPGECSINLKNPVTVSDGDIINIKCGFLDTIQSGSGKIKVTPEEAKSFSISYYLYNQNINPTGKIFNKSPPTNPLTTLDTPYDDNNTYVVCDTVAAGGATDGYSNYDRFTFYKRAGSILNNSMGGGIVQFTYTDIHGNTNAIANINVPKVDISNANAPTTIVVTDQVIVAKQDSMKLLSTASYMRLKLTLEAHKIDLRQEAHTAAALTMTPTLFKFDFEIPEGDYLPDELSDILSNKIGDINNAIAGDEKYAVGFAANNKFILQSEQLPNHTSTAAGQIPFLVSTDGKSTLQYPEAIEYGTPAKYLPKDSGIYADGDTRRVFNIGSSEIGILYDEGVNKMYFSQTHSNIYDTNKDIVVKPIEFKQTISGTATDTYSWAGSSGGVLFQDLQPSSVWFDKMGFDSSTLLVTTTQSTLNISTELPNVTTTSFTNFEAGKTHTDAYVGVDASVLKGDTYDQSSNFGNLLAGATSTLNRRIFAKDALNVPLSNQGYLLVELNGLPPKRLIGRQTEESSITAIVSRFYTNQGYTAFQGDQAIAYEHEGASFKISKLGFRIKDPNHELSELVDDDNTIFVEIVKKNPVALIADEI